MDSNPMMTKTGGTLSSLVELSAISGKGRGVVAKESILVSEIIEVAATWQIDKTELTLIDRTRGFEYYFVREKTTDSGEVALECHLVFGLASLVNHSDNPNCEVCWSESEHGPLLTLKAIRDITAGEEITHRYKNVFNYPNTIVFI